MGWFGQRKTPGQSPTNAGTAGGSSPGGGAASKPNSSNKKLPPKHKRQPSKSGTLKTGTVKSTPSTPNQQQQQQQGTYQPPTTGRSSSSVADSHNSNNNNNNNTPSITNEELTSSPQPQTVASSASAAPSLNQDPTASYHHSVVDPNHTSDDELSAMEQDKPRRRRPQKRQEQQQQKRPTDGGYPSYDDAPTYDYGDDDDEEAGDSTHHSRSTGVGPGDSVVGAMAPNQNHLNSLFNGHLMKWKFEAEEGTLFLRFPAILLSLGTFGVAAGAFVEDQPNSLEAHSIVIYVTVIAMAIVVLILDSRLLASHPLSIRAHVRNVMTRNCNIFRFVWGRAILYVIIGALNIGQMYGPAIWLGSLWVALGAVSALVGIHASRKFASLRNSLADESFLLLVFTNYDGDADGYIDAREFAYLLQDIGVELDDRYTLKAFHTIDTNGDQLISFEEFAYWWSSGFVSRGRRMHHPRDHLERDDDDDDTNHRRSRDEDESSYQRMDGAF